MTQTALHLRTQIRQQKRQQRRNLTKSQQVRASTELLATLCSLDEIHNAQHIATYIANDSEIDLTPFNHWCWQQGKQTYLPVIHPFSKGHLLFLRYDHNSLMQVNKYGILEPKLSVKDVLPVSDLDIILTPLVAFDEQGNRIGMGGGYYDRTLAPLKESNYAAKYKVSTPMAIGIAHECQKVSAIPHEYWDIPLVKIATDQACYLNQSHHLNKFKSNS